MFCVYILCLLTTKIIFNIIGLPQIFTKPNTLIAMTTKYHTFFHMGSGTFH